ncbi:hypothetical protein ACOMHN_015094 [Nucella lapillus]
MISVTPPPYPSTDAIYTSTMLGLLQLVASSCHHALASLRQVSVTLPGSAFTQALVVGALAGFLTYRLTRKSYRLPPGPRPWPLLGNLLWLTSKEEQFYVTLARWAREKFGPVICVYLGPVACVTLNDLGSATEALMHKGTDYAGRPSLHSVHVITEGSKDIAFTDYCPAWKLHRKIALKAIRHYMTGSHLDKVVHEVMVKVGDKMAAERGSFDPHTYTATLLFHLINSICFGESRALDDPEIQNLVFTFDKMNKKMGNGFYEDIIPLLKYWPTKPFREATALNCQLREYIEKNIQKHREKFSPENVSDVTDSILLAQREATREESAEVMAMFTDTHVRQTVTDLFAAGVDTSRTTMDWALLFMAGHPEMQKRAQAEIDAVAGTEMPRVGHRSQLPYTQAVLQETMRLGIVAPLALPHKTRCDTTVGGYDVPKDTMVLVNLWALAHDPQLWEEPHTFNPERFLDEQGQLKPTPKGWLPFSAGPRMCVGETVAKAELLLLLTSLLQRFVLSLPRGQAFCPVSLVGSMVSHLPTPYKIVVTPRSPGVVGGGGVGGLSGK